MVKKPQLEAMIISNFVNNIGKEMGRKGETMTTIGQ